MDVRCGTGEDAVVVVLVDKVEASACLALEDGVEHDRILSFLL
jgi:hypothetical protein